MGIKWNVEKWRGRPKERKVGGSGNERIWMYAEKVEVKKKAEL